jgi:hypothetical protein
MRLVFHFLSVFVFRGGMTERMVQRERGKAARGGE